MCIHLSCCIFYKNDPSLDVIAIRMSLHLSHPFLLLLKEATHCKKWMQDQKIVELDPKWSRFITLPQLKPICQKDLYSNNQLQMIPMLHLLLVLSYSPTHLHITFFPDLLVHMMGYRVCGTSYLS